MFYLFVNWHYSVYFCTVDNLNRTLWRHQMETFSAILALCVWNSPVTGEFSTQRPVTRSFDFYFDQRLNKRLSKQPRGWWFETLSSPLWRHCNGYFRSSSTVMKYDHPSITASFIACCLTILMTPVIVAHSKVISMEASYSQRENNRYYVGGQTGIS